MGYIEQTLTQDEQIIARGKPSFWQFVPAIVASVLGIVFILIVSLSAAAAARNAGNQQEAASAASMLGCCNCPIIIFVLSQVVRVLVVMLTTELALTNKRIVAKYGLIRRQALDLRLEKVESVGIDQSIVGRIFNFGSLVVSGAATRQLIPGISDPMVFRQACMQALDNQQRMEKSS